MTGPVASPRPLRLASIDAYRGFVMFLMMAEVLNLCAVSSALPDSTFWKFLCHHESHVAWVGCSLHDLIAPGFDFLVGVALPFSLASRRAHGASVTSMARHGAMRVGILILLGVAMESLHPRRMTWSFSDTLSQIGLGYAVLFPLAFRPARDWWIVFGLILATYWLAFVVYPLPTPDFDYAKVGVSEEWLKTYGLTGFAAHWQKNSNLAWAFDIRFLNLFPRQAPFAYHRLGLATLNFVPTVATMILGLVAGTVLRSDRDPWAKVRRLAIAGVTGLTSGWLLGALGICPVVKAIWTPSWVLFSGGWCFLLMAGFYTLADVWNQKRWFFPLIVIGTNSIAAYCGDELFSNLAFHSLERLLGRKVFEVFGDAYEHLVYGSVILLGYWLALFLMYRKKLFLRI